MGVYLGTEKISVYTGGIISKPEEEKTVTAGTSVMEVLPSSGKTMKKVTINPTPSQEKTIEDPSETTVIIPDEGKLLRWFSLQTKGLSIFPTTGQ